MVPPKVPIWGHPFWLPETLTIAHVLNAHGVLCGEKFTAPTKVLNTGSTHFWFVRKRVFNSHGPIAVLLLYGHSEKDPPNL